MSWIGYKRGMSFFSDNQFEAIGAANRELDRLKADNARLRELIADTCDRNGTLRPYGIEMCPWCRTDEASGGYHPDGCPAFTTKGEVR